VNPQVNPFNPPSRGGSDWIQILLAR